VLTKTFKIFQKNILKGVKIWVQLYFYKLFRAVLRGALVASIVEISFLVGFAFMAQASCFSGSTSKITYMGRSLHALVSGSVLKVSLCFGFAFMAQASCFSGSASKITYMGRSLHALVSGSVLKVSLCNEFAL